MAKHKNDAQLYLEMYPGLAKRWINQCVICQRQGYKPDMPEDIYPGVAGKNLRAYFEPLELNECGLCDLCADVL